MFQRGLTSSLFLLLSGFAFSIATGRHWVSHAHLSPAVLRRARRFGLFVVLGYALHFPVARFADFSSATPERWRSFLAVDVLQLIGVTFIGVQAVLLATRSRRVFGWTAFALAIAMFSSRRCCGALIGRVAAAVDRGVSGARGRLAVSAVPVVGLRAAWRRPRAGLLALGRSRLTLTRPWRSWLRASRW